MKTPHAIIQFLCITINICNAQQDTLPPVFIMKGPACVQVCKGSTYTDPGFDVYDMPDSSENELTISQEGSFIINGTSVTGYYKLRYKAVDRNGNVGYSEWRKIQVVDSVQLPGCQPKAVNCDAMDTIPPTINLKGDPAASVCRCCSFEDVGYDVSDNLDSTQYLKVEMEGSYVNEGSKIEGVFTLRYKVTDRSGNFAYSEWRYVFVRNPFEFPCEGTTNAYCCLSAEDVIFSSKFNIYPNPAQNQLFIETNEYVDAISVFDITGKLVREFNIGGKLTSTYKIDVKHFPAGIYLIKVTNGKEVIVKKIEIR